jgi:hypothetical protein
MEFFLVIAYLANAAWFVEHDEFLSQLAYGNIEILCHSTEPYW